MANHGAAPIPSKSFIRQDADYTLVSQTGAQALFNTSAHGRITLPTGVYLVSGAVYVTGMSTTSGNADINLLGSGGATLAHQMVEILGRDGAANAAGATVGGTAIYGQNNAGVDIVTAGTVASMHFLFSGMFKVTAAGTLVPSIALTTAAAAVVKAGSHLVLEKVAELGTNYAGSWD